MAVSRLRITVGEFYNMTPVEFHYALEDIANSQMETIKSRMEAARFIAVHIWNSAGKSMKHKQFDPHKLLPFSWDVSKPVEKQSVNTMKTVMMGITKKQNSRIDKKKK